MLVMESAATRRSFLKFLLGPENRKWDQKKPTYSTDVFVSNSLRRNQLWMKLHTILSFVLTLRKGFLNIAAHPGEGILRRVRVSVWRRSTYRAEAGRARSRGGGVRGPSCLSLRDHSRTFRNISFQVLVEADGFYCRRHG